MQTAKLITPIYRFYVRTKSVPEWSHVVDVVSAGFSNLLQPSLLRIYGKDNVIAISAKDISPEESSSL